MGLPPAQLRQPRDREALIFLLTQTHQIFDATPWYHLGAGALGPGSPPGPLHSPLERMTDWLMQAAPFQAMREVADYDAIWCGEGPLPVPDRLADIHVPVYAAAAAGGFGELARYTTTQLGSNDVTFTGSSLMNPRSRAAALLGRHRGSASGLRSRRGPVDVTAASGRTPSQLGAVR